MSLLYTNLNAILKAYGIDPQTVREFFRAPRTISGNVALWDHNDARLELASFSGTVPSFIVNQDQVILDWNPAFELIFGEVFKLRKNIPVSHWYKHLENFRRVENRTEEFFGEGILPIADRHRIVFISPKYGRMVFTKIMSPLVDRNTGRILGWSFSLNINSVNKRNEFLEDFFAAIKHKSENLRFVASYDGVFANSDIYQDLVRQHLLAHGDNKNLLELNARTGELSFAKIDEGGSATAVHGMVEFLRIMRHKANSLRRGHMHIVERKLSELKSLPSNKYESVAMMHGFYKHDDVDAVLAQVYRSMKDGGIFTYSQLLGDGQRIDYVESYLATIKKNLEAKNLFDNMKYQFQHVSSTFEKYEADRLEPRIIISALKRAGFKISITKSVDGFYAFIHARK